MAARNNELLNDGQPTIGTIEYFLSAQFWFESMQNWQSEFLSVAVLVLLTVYLREVRSAQSKLIEEPSRREG